VAWLSGQKRTLETEKPAALRLFDVDAVMEKFLRIA